jgi:hypothetical protein
MRLHHCITVLVLALLGAAPTMHAQQAADPVMPRAGSWGAEAVMGDGFGANLLRFSSPTAAWLAGLSFAAIHQTDNFSDFPGGENQSGWLGYGNAHLGRRWWRGGSGERLRPLAGVGALGALYRNPGSRSWNAGAYGELGASYFFSPHVSLGATGELTAVYSEDRFFSAIPPDRIATRWIVRGNLVRVNASVYF